MKKLISLLVALVMVLSLATVVSAADTVVEATVVNNTGHEYHAHQIFSGTQAKGEAMLGEVEWGSGVDDSKTDELIAELQKVTIDGKTPFANCATAADVANVLSASGNNAYAYNTPEALAFARVVNKYLATGVGAYTVISEAENSKVQLKVGYYLLEDVTGADNTDGVTGLSLLQITGHTININSKTDKPSVGKKVQDEVADRDIDSMDTTGGWGESADHTINESFKFELLASIPDDVNIDQYSVYKVVFADQMSDGVTFEQVDSVKINGVVVPAMNADKTNNGYYLSDNALNGAAGISWTLTIDDIKPYLNGAAAADGTTAAAADAITIEVIISAHLNEDAVIATSGAEVGQNNSNNNTVQLKYSNNPNAGGEGDLGVTPTDTVWVFTYKIDATKFEKAIQNGNELAGAGFTLYTEAEYAKLTDDSEDTVATPISLIKANDGYHYPVADGTAGAITEMVTTDDGKFNVKGLDTGVYYMVETTVPAGYNPCEDVKVEIAAQHEEVNETTTVTHITMKQNDTVASDLHIDVVNMAGATLPETGGIGTTIFYVLGAVLVLGAVVLLVTKKRMSVAE